MHADAACVIVVFCDLMVRAPTNIPKQIKIYLVFDSYPVRLHCGVRGKSLTSMMVGSQNSCRKSELHAKLMERPMRTIR